jgi:hypothetical protein
MKFNVLEKMFLFIALPCIASWIANLVKLIGMSFDPLTGMAVARTIGVFVPPVGVILGVF